MYIKTDSKVLVLCVSPVIISKNTANEERQDINKIDFCNRGIILTEHVKRVFKRDINFLQVIHARFCYIIVF